VLDGILAERAGIPAVAIITEPFHETGKAMAQSWGVPSFRFLEMPHPIARLEEQEIRDAAKTLAEQVASALKQGH
jgi:hypothetical protein